MDHVQITNVTKKGDWYRVEGGIAGKRGHADIPASSIEGKTRGQAEALFKRGVLSGVLHEKE